MPTSPTDSVRVWRASPSSWQCRGMTYHSLPLTVPEVAPRHLACETRSPTSVRLTWNRVTDQEAGGRVTGYWITWRRASLRTGGSEEVIWRRLSLQTGGSEEVIWRRASLRTSGSEEVTWRRASSEQVGQKRSPGGGRPASRLIGSVIHRL